MYAIWDLQLNELKEHWSEDFESKEGLKSEFEDHMRYVLSDGTEIEEVKDMSNEELWTFFEYTIVKLESKKTN